MPARTDDTTWDGLRAHSEHAAQAALDQLRLAKAAGLVAGVLVLAGSAAILIAGPAPASPTAPTVIAVVDGKAVCGQLRSGSSLSVGSTVLERVTNLVVVPACP
jgi:hypothetical protein